MWNALSQLEQKVFPHPADKGACWIALNKPFVAIDKDTQGVLAHLSEFE